MVLLHCRKQGNYYFTWQTLGQQLCCRAFLVSIVFSCSLTPKINGLHVAGLSVTERLQRPFSLETLCKVGNADGGKQLQRENVASANNVIHYTNFTNNKTHCEYLQFRAGKDLRAEWMSGKTCVIVSQSDGSQKSNWPQFAEGNERASNNNNRG